MKTTLLSAAAVLLLAGAMIVPTHILARASGAADPTPPQVLKGREEGHPNIQAAIRHLEQAKESLQKAPSKFGGHKAKALDLTDEAIRECREALRFADKK